MFFAPVVRTRRTFTPSFPGTDRSLNQFLSTLAFDAKEDEKGWTLSLDLPGVTREDLNITVEGAVVRIETRTEAKRQYKAGYEFADEIDVDGTAATLENGVLTLTLPKKQPVSNARTIQVK